MPTVLLIFGMRFFFYPNDHEPIHVHVEYQGGYAKIQVYPEILVLENSGLKKQIIKRAIDTVRLYQDDFIAAWENTFGKRKNDSP